MSNKILVIIIIAIVLRLAMVFLLPDFAGPDERDHYDYVKYLYQQRSLPVDTFQDSRGEFFQAPLYYLMLLPGFALSHHQPLWLSLRVLRLFNVALAGVVIWLVYLTVRQAFPTRRGRDLGAAAFAAFHPVYVRNSCAVNNDNLLILLCCLLFYRLLAVDTAKNSLKNNFGTGLLLGLGILTKTSMVAMIPVVILIGIWPQEGGTKPLSRLVGLAITFGVAALTGGLWLARNYFLYHNAMGMGLSWPRNADPFTLAFQLYSAKHAFVTFWRTLAGGRERMVWDIFKWPWLGLNLLATVGCLSLLKDVLRNRSMKSLRNEVAMCVLVASFVAAGWLFGMKYGKGIHGFFDGRLIFPAMTGLGLLFAAGVQRLLPQPIAEKMWIMESILFITTSAILLLIL